MAGRVGVLLRATPEQGGIYQYQLLVLAALARLPEDVEVTVYHARPGLSALADPHPRLRRRAVPAMRWWEAALGLVGRHVLPRAWIARLQPLSWALAQPPPDLMVYPTPCAQSFELGVPYVMAVHDLQHRLLPQFPEVSAWGEYRRREYIYGAGCREAAGLLVDSALGREQVQAIYGVDPARVHVLPYVAPALPDDPTGRALDRFALPARFFFYPAQFWRHKNHRTLVDAVARLRARGTRVHLALAGAPRHEYRAIAHHIRELELADEVLLLGYVTDQQLSALYRRARALVMPTFFGPTNLPPLEAFASGCPVAISDLPGVREQVGDAALLFAPNDADSIARALERLWDDDALCRQLIEAGTRRLAAWTPGHFQQRLCEIISKELEMSILRFAR